MNDSRLSKLKLADADGFGLGIGTGTASFFQNGADNSHFTSFLLVAWVSGHGSALPGQFRALPQVFASGHEPTPARTVCGSPG